MVSNIKNISDGNSLCVCLIIRLPAMLPMFRTGTFATKSICLANERRYLNPGSVEYFWKVSSATVRVVFPPRTKNSFALWM